MAILLLVGPDQVHEPYDYLNDIIDIFPDDHVFTQHELDSFNFLTVNGSVVDVTTRVRQFDPVIGSALMGTDGDFTFDRGVPTTGEEIEVWSNMTPPIRWYKLVKPFKHMLNIGDLTQQEKDELATIDINHPSVDAYIKKLIKNYDADPLNNEVVKELQGEIWGG